MCLAIPGIIREINAEQQQAHIDYRGVMKTASTRLCPQAAVGDYALVHAGFIIQLMDEEQGAELTELAGEAGLYD